jgi:hypothetical protein
LSKGVVKSLADSIISFVELIEAEGRELRSNIVRFCFMAVFFIIAGVMTICGFVLLFNGLFNFVADTFGRLPAYFATGSSCILISAVLFAVGFSGISTKRRERKVGFVDEWSTEGHVPLGGKGEPEEVSGNDKPDGHGEGTSD